MPARIAVVHYSSTAHVHQLAEAVAAGAADAGAEVRLRRAAELAPEEAIRANDRWWAHHQAVKDTVPEATHEDMTWATGYALGSPARYGLPASQLKQFIDTLAPLWNAGELKDKVATAFTSSQNDHGGQETTLLALLQMVYHWGSLILPPDSTTDAVKAIGANPYGTGFPAGSEDAVPAPFLAAAREQGARLAVYAERVAGT